MGPHCGATDERETTQDDHADEALRLVGMEVRPATRGLLLKAMRGSVMQAYLRDDPRHDQAALAMVDAVVPPPPNRSAPPERALTLPLRDLLASYERYAVIKPRTLVEVRYAIEGLIGFLGHGDATRIQRADLARWRDDMTERGRSANTFNNRLSLVGQVLAWGVKEELLQDNVAALSLRLPKAKTAARVPYSDAQAAQILEAARLEVRPSLRWAHWIMAFSGARAGEVLQLERDDILSDEGTLRAAGVEEYLRDALLGHARKTTGRVYGLRGESLVSLAERLARIPVPSGVTAPRQAKK